jgi:hydroxymethylpyrimidine pyrophosphatase-like HAD family hydrolase
MQTQIKRKELSMISDDESLARAAACGLLPLDSREACALLSSVTLIYTDLDGTLLAPGGRLFCNHAGEPSSALADVFVKLKQAGIHIVLVTGRNHIQGSEIMRLIDADAVICEMGTVKQVGIGSDADITFDMGDFVMDPQFETPFEAIGASGALELLYQTYPHHIEPNDPWNSNRKVTQLLRGCVDVDEVDALFKAQGLALQLKDNGIIYPPNHSLAACSDIHGYHVVPRNTSKALAVQRDIAKRRAEGSDSLRAIAIGDGFSDLEMGRYVDGLVVMLNGLNAKRNCEWLRSATFPHFVTSKRTIDGWVEFAKALLKANAVR